ncbi:MAG: hypothetical protein WD601_03855, partial [Pseudohongiellaceae bacterium]
MRKTRIWLTLSLMLALAACGKHSEDKISIPAPVAKIIPTTLTIHGHTRTDDYYWIRDDTRSNPEVLSLLAAENEYARAMLADTESLQNRLFNEITARLKDHDSTVPIKQGDYFYHREFRAGGEYPVYLRRPEGANTTPEVILDVNTLSREHEYYRVGNWSVSQKQNILAFAEDTLGRRKYTIRFKDLETGEMLPDKIEGVGADIAWGNDNRSLFYVAKHPRTLLPYKVFRHVLGTPVAEDQLVYEERDDTFYTSVYKSRSEEYVMIAIH